MTEDIIGTLHEVSRHSYDIVYDLHFTTERVVAVLIQSPHDVQTSISPWTFLIGNMFAKRQEQQERQKIVQERHRQSGELTPDELIEVNPDNFAIPYNSIDSVEIKSRFFDYHLIFQISGNPDRKPKTDFILKKNLVPEAEALLEKVLSSKIKKNLNFYHCMVKVVVWSLTVTV